MIVAVTGGTGFIGSAVVRAHLAQGDRVRILTRRAGVHPWPGVRYVNGDLARGDVPSDFVDGVDVLYHCAGELREEGRMRALHVDGTRRLLARARGRIGRWVQLSSVGVYGPHRDGIVTEQTPAAPVGVYEITKAESDDLVRSAMPEAVVVRPSIVFGPEMPGPSLFALISMIDRGLFFFIGPRGASANYVPIEHVVDALVLCGASRAAAGDVFNVSACRPIETFVGAIAEALGSRRPRLRLPRAAVRLAASALGRVPGWPLSTARVDALSRRVTYSTRHIELTLGYRPSTTMEDALRRTVAQWRLEHAAR
jgi:nucleoside-diphosphate-sugar epimerase